MRRLGVIEPGLDEASCNATAQHAGAHVHAPQQRMVPQLATFTSETEAILCGSVTVRKVAPVLLDGLRSTADSTADRKGRRPPQHDSVPVVQLPPNGDHTVRVELHLNAALHIADDGERVANPTRSASMPCPCYCR